jgi:asparagine synthase (glutamine-hydrolysing)
MCGIAGIFFKKNVNEDLLNRFENLVQTKQHKRGPDKFGKLEVKPNLFFFHNMLSIIDIGNASQPMEDEKGVITYNGEIYNYKDLRYKDERYYKKSDTEVLLKGLNRNYIGFLKKTNSMFGFGYFNREKQIVTICRDRIGIKPVYFIDNDEVFAFASTITALVIFSKKRLNNEKLWQYYLNRAFKAPSTIFDDVFEVPAASFLEYNTVNNQISEIKQWWQREQTSESFSNENEVIEQIEQLLNDSIRNRLVADVPVGLFLSGGVDSSLIAALTSKQRSNLNAFTVSFHDQNFDESNFAKQVCKQYDIEYNEIRVNANEFVGNIENWIKIQDDIVADPSALLLYKISEYASSLNFRALLAGEGSDELFGGYNSYKYFNWSSQIHKFGGSIVPFKDYISGLFKNDSKKRHFVINSLNRPKFMGTASIFEPHLLQRLISDFEPELPARAFSLKSAMDLDIKDRLPNDILTRSDRSTSGTSVELRVPFLAHQLVDYSAGICKDLFLKDKTSKYLIKKLAAKYLPNDLIYRKKVGFDLPIKEWISKDLRDIIWQSITHSAQKDFIHIGTIEECFNLHINRNIDYSTKLWAFLCLELSYKYLSKI